MLFTIQSLAAIFTTNKNTHNDTVIKSISIDSRNDCSEALFVPIIGETFDSHDFIEQAINNGASAILWDKEKAIPSNFPVVIPIFFVKDTVMALQQLAKIYRNEIDPIVIGITGSNGKTTTKDLVASVLKNTYKTHCTAGNFNNHIGMPLTILSMPRDTEVLVLEMGMNNFKEIHVLSLIAQPDYAIITNIGESHIEFLGSRAGIAQAKLEILDGLKTNGQIIIDGDVDLLADLHNLDNVTTCGFKRSNNVVISNVKIKQDKTDFMLTNDKAYEVPLLGKHHAQNATYAITIANMLKVSTREINLGLEKLDLTSMRFEVKIGKKGVTVINDAYNASLTSMKAAIDVVKQMDGFTDKVLILGDVLELGKYTDEFHRSIADFIDRPITALYTFGDQAKLISTTVKQQDLPIKSAHFTSREQLINELQPYLHDESLLLFKASRGLFFEKLVKEVL